MALGYFDESEQDVLKLTDFRMAGYLVTRNVRFLGSELNAKNEVVFRFDNTGGVARATLDTFPASPEQRYDAACRKMHEVVRTVLSVEGKARSRR